MQHWYFSETLAQERMREVARAAEQRRQIMASSAIQDQEEPVEERRAKPTFFAKRLRLSLAP